MGRFPTMEEYFAELLRVLKSELEYKKKSKRKG